MMVGSCRIRSANRSIEAKHAAAVKKNEPLHSLETFLGKSKAKKQRIRQNHGMCVLIILDN
jgi:hypothetical protein